MVCLTFALPINAQESQQECSDMVVNTVGKFLKISSFNAKSENSGIVASACKASPNDSDKVYSVFAYTAVGQKKTKPSNELETKQLIVASVSLASQQVVSSYQGEIEEDAETEVGSFRIDTARYQLTKNVRAFGVIFNSSARGPSCADGRYSQQLTLYTQQNSKLMPLLNLPLVTTLVLKGCLGQSAVKSIWETANLSISVTKSESNGYVDLLLTTKIVREFDDEAKPAVKKKDEKRLMRFNGETYKNSQTPAWWLLFN